MRPTQSRLLALFGYPVLVSPAFRVPVITVGEDGIRLPLVGPSLRWYARCG